VGHGFTLVLKVVSARLNYHVHVPAEESCGSCTVSQRSMRRNFNPETTDISVRAKSLAGSRHNRLEFVRPGGGVPLFEQVYGDIASQQPQARLFVRIGIG